MRRTCVDCGKPYGAGQGEGGHCTACHRSFASDSAFTRHRVTTGRERVCAPVTETDGWRQTPKGYWTNRPVPQPGEPTER